ncbi:peptidoglycan recognition protein family protein [Actinomadura parmotrematis]|uniref:Peptidoglycan recognition protein family protein n=1 Tax=Actinomadura parmotrematis TaxID=2864039 RepID=A0ABS7G5F8_9ACTN|nr:peptidoglycan recognition family protein [Actinomadura parmotrematis]MBW8487032.1 peptidoglycan recognition protein family protein [Actinomadura parmotrematis]
MFGESSLRGGDAPTRRALLAGLAGLPAALALDALAEGLLDNEAMAAPLDAALRLPFAGPSGARPLVRPRTAWKARPPRHRARVLDRAPDHIVVHHTASANSTDYSLEHAYALSRSIQRFHMGPRGWDDTGQQLTISRGGHVMEGRNGSLASIMARRHTVGAQALHHNEHTIGIENEGTYMTRRPPGAQWDSLIGVCAWLCDQYRLDPYKAIVGHRDYCATDCPGDALYARLPALRDGVAARLGYPEKAPAPVHVPRPPISKADDDRERITVRPDR